MHPFSSMTKNKTASEELTQRIVRPKELLTPTLPSSQGGIERIPLGGEENFPSQSIEERLKQIAEDLA
jgi:hypothetical protein